MIHEGGAFDCEDGLTQEQTLWRNLAENTIYKKKGYKCNISRFCAIVSEGRELRKRWTASLFEATVPAIEHNMINKAALAKIKLKTDGADEASINDATSSKKLSVGDRTLRSCGVNAVVITMATLSDESHYRSLTHVIDGAIPTMHFGAHASRELRDVKRSQAWLLAQVRGGLFDHMLATLRIMVNEDFMREARFAGVAFGADVVFDDGEIGLEDEHAESAGMYMIFLARNRLRRTVYLFGWPYRAILVMGSEAEGNGVLDAFGVDHKMFLAACAVPNPNLDLRTFIARSHFQKGAVEQLLLACGELGFKPHPDIREVVSDNTLTVSLDDHDDVDGDLTDNDGRDDDGLRRRQYWRGRDDDDGDDDDCANDTAGDAVAGGRRREQPTEKQPPGY
jgi:hypothetical protein